MKQKLLKIKPTTLILLKTLMKRIRKKLPVTLRKKVKRMMEKIKLPLMVLRMGMKKVRKSKRLMTRLV